MDANLSQPGQHAQAQGDGSIIVQSYGDNVTINASGQPYLRLFPGKVWEQTPRPGRELDLLDPRCRALDLIGRDRDLDDLHSWLEDDSYKISIRTLIGRAGAGKTRLALELLCTLEEKQPGRWEAGFVRAQELRRFSSQHNISSWAWRKPLLIIVDYAAAMTETLRTWLPEIAEVPMNRPPLRLLLLERYANVEEGWLRLLFLAGPRIEDLFSPPSPVAVQPLFQNSDRRRLLSRMLDEVARIKCSTKLKLPEPGENVDLDDQLTRDEWNDPLYLLMAALVAQSSGLQPALSLKRTDLASVLARHEGRRLDVAFQEGMSGARVMLRHLAAYATVCGGLTTEQTLTVAEQECEALKLIFPEGPGALAEIAGNLLGRGDGALAALVPDIVGEAFVLENWRGGGGHKHAPTMVRAAQGRGKVVAEFLTRLFQDFTTAERLQLEPLTWLDALVQAGQTGDPALLLDIEASLPHKTTELRIKAVELTELLIKEIRSKSDRQSRHILARLLNNYSLRLRDVGRRPEALKAAVESIGLVRDIHRTNPGTLKHLFVSALNNLASAQIGLGRREEALKSAKEALENCHLYSRDQPYVFKPVLALSLSTLSAVLYHQGQRREALAAAEQSLQLTQSLYNERPDDFRQQLSEILSNMAVFLLNLGRPANAIPLATKAAELNRFLARAQPDAFTPDLGRSLNCLANALFAAGRRDESLGVSQETVELYRKLADSHPHAFRPDLAMTLNNLGNGLYLLGRWTEALAAVQESTELYRSLAASEPDTFLPGLAMSLKSMGGVLSALKEPRAALGAAQEAVDLYRTLSTKSPGTFKPDFAGSLSNLSIMRAACNLREEALVAAKESEGIFRELAETLPDAFTPDLALSLNTVANRLVALDRPETALTTIEEALSIYRPLHLAQPKKFTPDLARSLAVRGKCLAGLKRYGEASEVCRESIQLLLPFFRNYPQALADQISDAAEMYASWSQKAGAIVDVDLIAEVSTILKASVQSSI